MTKHSAALLLGIMLATMISPNAKAACHSRSDVCAHVNHCLNDLSNDPYVQWDRKRILDGIKDNIGNMVWLGTRNCQTRIGQDSLRKFEYDSAGCSDAEYVAAGKYLQSGGLKACKEVWSLKRCVPHDGSCGYVH